MAELVGKRFDSSDEVREFAGGKRRVDLVDVNGSARLRPPSAYGSERGESPSPHAHAGVPARTRSRCRARAARPASERLGYRHMPRICAPIMPLPAPG